MASHPEWCDPSRCDAGAGTPAAVHRSAPYPVPGEDGATALLALWQPAPTVDMPEPAVFVEILAGFDALEPVIAVQASRQHERRVVRARLRNHIDLLTAELRRAA